ncbi:DUF2891 family protein [Streptomyces sp. NBC_00984]|nr:DUF2891 family protein [Streptomyces sp. NBC_00984]
MIGPHTRSGTGSAPTARSVRGLRTWFTPDHDAPAHWEPSGLDFFSPGVAGSRPVPGYRVIA